MLATLLFPIVEKVLHDIGHINDEHCGIMETHICEVEHDCSVCEYLFSSLSTPPKDGPPLNIYVSFADNSVPELVLNTIPSRRYSISLRAPPAV